MMKYLRIASKSRTNSVDMFTLGVSTARGTDKIGQFGSGSLMGTLCWMRHEGDSPIFGLNGTRVEFDCTLTKKSDGEAFRQVFMLESKPMSLAKRTPLSVCLEYGEVDWTEPHMALREWISNAIDQNADIADKETVKVVEESEMDFPEDSVVVYIPFSGMVKKYFNNIDKYFLHFLGLEKQATIKKDKATTCRIYRRGVFIREMEFKSVFDYNLDFSINESRNGSSDSIRSDILQFSLGASGNRPDSDYVEHLTKHILANSDCMEVREPYYYQGVYGDAWNNFLKGQSFKCHPGHEDGRGHSIQSHWYKRFVNANSKLDGMTHMTKTVKEGNIIVQNPPELDKTAERIWEMIDLCQLTNGKEMPKVECFKTRDGSLSPSNGVYDKVNGVVSIWERAINSETILHEFGHHITGADDRTREFTAFFSRICIELMSLNF